MGHYASNIPVPPRLIPEADQKRLLDITGQRRDGFRDHLIIALGLATGLRAHEIVALNVGDVVTPNGTVRRVVYLTTFKRAAKVPAPQEVALSETIRRKMEKFIAWKKSEGQDLAAAAPLFVSRLKRRLSLRQLRAMFRTWQDRLGIERPYNFHQLRHAACTSLYRRTKDIRLTARFARHRSLESTQRYAHATLEDLVAAVQDLPC